MISAPQDCGCPVVVEGASITNSPICGGTYLFMVILQSYLWGRCDIATPCQRIQSVKELEMVYDFIVVGAGAAGSIVAGRLSENEDMTVLLMEAGGPEPIGARVPSFYREFWGNKEVDWDYRTEPSPDYCRDQGGKGCQWPRGKVLGGSSVLNGMMYHRGHEADLEDWEKAGAKGWSWNDMQKYFDKTEGNKQIGTLVSGKYHSAKGPLPVQTFNYQPPALQDLKDAIKASGFPVIDDMNDPNTPDGFAIAQTFNDNGQRYTTARVYLDNRRQNLSVKLNSQVTKVLFDDHRRAVGVEYMDKDGEFHRVFAKKEVILSAGALNSPHILLLSGIGLSETLEKFNIPVISDLPVGQNLRNHVGVTMYYRLKKVNNTEMLNWNVLSEYLLNRKGPMSSTGLTQLTGLLYSRLADRARKQPDIQFFFNGLYAECSRTGVIGELVDCEQSTYNVTANAAILLPRSTGNLTLQCTDPTVPPIFNPNFFDHPDDMVMAMDGIDYLERIFMDPGLQERYEVVLDPEYNKACDKYEAWSPCWKECTVREHTDPQNHQLGTTAIGSVVDSQLRVINVAGLRVIDAGSMPTQPTGNPQGLIMALAEKGADLIKQSWS